MMFSVIPPKFGPKYLLEEEGGETFPSNTYPVFSVEKKA